MSLNTQSFLVVQMLHVIKIIISMKGTESFSLIILKICRIGLVVMNVTPMEFQHALAKLHLGKIIVPAVVMDLTLVVRCNVTLSRFLALELLELMVCKV
jgi:predicted membrane chloride channel (bestrophin family)